ncbi:MATE family efflux transporter [Shewanella sp. JM162201]|uniref:MATE family efflux transporter n=1 Tax=Shewanella jiangmenensis TaxID=2837387 RepID=A0ABS5V9R3_9GAMM|nr:MATE family efflux transporter [Shewanella jiangmenensis]MBT1445768.1 MATE family efflux transporter [Shewanella jiangmenensis]
MQAKFVEGPILRHILVMSSTAAVGISALFVVDLLDIFFLSLLGDHELTAAIGYAGTISFFTTSIGIGLSIALGAQVSRAIGSGDSERARRLLMSALMLTLGVSVLVAVIVTLNISTLLALVGASGRTAELAADYLNILVPSLPFICLAMALGAALRAVGDAKLSMVSTLVGGGVNLVLDPVFIFLFAMGIEGAAIASVLARLAVMVVAGRGVFGKHGLWHQPQLGEFRADLKPIFAIAGPAMLTNIATPIGNGFMTRAIAEFGDGYVAGWAVVGRLTPVAFGMIFALSGAIGPIVGQNFGAGRYDRLKDCLTQSLLFCTAYVVAVSLLLALVKEPVVHLFDLKGDAADFVRFFLTYIAVFFVFSGALFVANASFNNLGKAKYSTLFNVGKATLGTLPFIWLGAQWGGIHGVLLGQVLGSILFGVAGVFTAYRLVNGMAPKAAEATKGTEGTEATKSEHRKTEPLKTAAETEVDFAEVTPAASSPLSSSCTQMAQLTEEQDCLGATHATEFLIQVDENQSDENQSDENHEEEKPLDGSPVNETRIGEKPAGAGRIPSDQRGYPAPRRTE